MKINIGIIGINRGKKLIKLIRKTSLKFNVISIYDTDIKKLNILKKENPLIKTFSSPKNFFSDKKIDAIYIASPVKFHYKHSIKAAKNKKHILCEVPAFRKIKEGKEIKRLIKKNKLIYMMAENYCFSPQSIYLSKILENKKMGDIIFARSSYIHDCKDISFNRKNGQLTWRGKERLKRSGNDYPTHSIGPIDKILSKYYNDKLKYISTFSSKEIAMTKNYFSFFNNKKYRFIRPDVSFSIIETEKKTLIELICDTTSNRPSSMHDMYIQFLNGSYISGRSDNELSVISNEKYFKNSKFKKIDLKKYLDKKDQSLFKKLKHQFSFYKVLQNFENSIITKTKPYIDIYDAFLWSSLVELSKRSLNHRSRKIRINY